MTILDLSAIEARDAAIETGNPFLIPVPLKPISNAVVDRRNLLAYVHDLRAEIERLRNALDWIADPRGNDICTPQEIAEAALAREKP
jgi:hypothetical protein